MVGSVTSGGTESLILAVKAARDAHPEITHPRLVIPSTAHAAFAKAAHYLGVALDTVPVAPTALLTDAHRPDLLADPAVLLTDTHRPDLLADPAVVLTDVRRPDLLADPAVLLTDTHRPDLLADPAALLTDTHRLRADPAAMAAAIRPETVLVAASAPSYAHGVVDPIPELAAIAAARGIRFHVDACFGGWVLPYLRRLGAELPAFDFGVPGVTSISVDLHKYAYAPKGVSLLLHRDAALRLPQYFAYADWPGYTMVNPVISSTRSGGPIAAALATLRHLGDDGYLRLAGRTREAVGALAEAVEQTGGVRLYAPAETTVVCLAAEPGVDLFVLADELAARGWHTQPQLSYGKLSATIHLTVTAAVAATAAEFAPDLAAAVAATRARGPIPLPQPLLEAAGALTPEMVTPELIEGLAESLGLGEDIGKGMAAVNSLLNVVSPALREALLAGFLSLLQRPSW
ncbi:MAG: aminotransferase class V-fold PLP-dependent enzyme [Actinoplanes sp.]